jgi:hypothetical protein
VEGSCGRRRTLWAGEADTRGEIAKALGLGAACSQKRAEQCESCG